MNGFELIRQKKNFLNHAKNAYDVGVSLSLAKVRASTIPWSFF